MTQPDDSPGGAEAALGRGDWAQAARLMEAAGKPARAAALYERLLDFHSAALAYVAAGDAPAAVRCAARAGQPQDERTVLEEVRRFADGPALCAAAQAAQAVGRADLAAPLWDAAGAVDEAAEAYEATGQLATAARRRLAVGHHRAAGMLLERHLQAYPADAAAALELGTVLARFGKHDAATPLFRQASANPEVAERALRRLATSFWAQGHPHAAEKVLEELAVVAPEVPRDVLALAALETQAGAGVERTGTRVDRRYLLVQPHAATSLGDTYVAHDEFADRRVLLTLFRPNVARSAVLKQFAAVCQAAHALGLTQLVPLVEMNLASGFVATAVPAWPSLQTLLVAQDALPRASAVVGALAAALAALHRRGLVHGALHPGCVFVSPTGGVQLGDVGAGMLMALRETESMGLEASLATLAPEVVGGAPPGPAADQYALAAMTYRVTCGSWPSPSASARYVPAPLAALDAVLRTGLATRPGNRFPNVDAFAAALPPLHAQTTSQATVMDAAAPPQRLGAHGPLQSVGGVAWQPVMDLWLQRELWRVKASPGALAPLAVVAGLSFGVQRVLELDETAAVALLDSEPSAIQHDAGTGVRALAMAATALAALHDAGWALGPPVLGRLVGLVLRFSALPLPAHGTEEQRHADVVWLAQQASAWSPLLGGLPTGSAAELAHALLQRSGAGVEAAMARHASATRTHPALPLGLRARLWPA